MGSVGHRVACPVAHSGVNPREGHPPGGRPRLLSPGQVGLPSYLWLSGSGKWIMTSVDGRRSWEALGEEERVSLASASGWEVTSVSPHWAFHCLSVHSFALTRCHLSTKWPAPSHPLKCMAHICGEWAPSHASKGWGRERLLQGNVLQNSAEGMVS